ncbi:MAG: ABC-2 family transporter protein [Lachnospiraceae bacterium]|nr:ABC-2 family transporter protein [Lachnospiraceae bacterium]
MEKFTKLYLKCIKIAIAGAMAYRLNFILSTLLATILNALFPLVTILIYNAGASFPGWGFHEVLLIQGIFLLTNSLAALMFDGVLWSSMSHIREGTFEIVLLKPLPPLSFLIATSFTPEIFGGVVAGVILFSVSLSFTGIAGAIAIFQFLVMFAGGFSVITGLYMMMAAMSFKWVGNSRLTEIFDSIMTFGKYPASIFPSAIRGIATFIIPVAMIGFFPASALLGRAEGVMFLAVIPCLLFMLLGIWIYNKMIRLYEGVGG